jgi:hypothetical protein
MNIDPRTGQRVACRSCEERRRRYEEAIALSKKGSRLESLAAQELQEDGCASCEGCDRD